MQKILLLILLSAFSLIGISQSTDKKATFTITGNAKNFSGDFWELTIYGLYDYKRVNVPVDNQGRFSITLPAEHPEDLYLNISEDGVNLFAIPGDSLEINWDHYDVDKSLRFSSTQSWRQKELSLLLEQKNKFRSAYFQLADEIYNKQMRDSLKYQKVKKLFIDEINFIVSYPSSSNSTKIFCDTYFKYAQLLLRNNLLPKFDLSLADAIPQQAINSFGIVDIHFNWLNEIYIYQSNHYREFLFDRITAKPFNRFTNLKKTGAWDPNPVILNQCYAALAFGHYPLVRDWLIAKAIISGFRLQPFEDVEKVYRQFEPQLQSKEAIEAIQQFYADLLKPGDAAPAFTLKNESGKNIDLNDLKGKVVYIDFWDTECPYCIIDIKQHVPKLHEKYKNKNVAFVNVCLEEDQEKWQKALVELRLQGVNLLAEDVMINKIINQYNIGATPRYVLLDTSGKIVKLKAARPSELILPAENELDKLLKLSTTTAK